MQPASEQFARVSEAYDAFLRSSKALSTNYAKSGLKQYLETHRARITSQIAQQLAIIERDNLGVTKLLSLGGWPGIAPIILKRLTQIDCTMIDHPALLSDAMDRFYKQYEIETARFNFADAESEPLPANGPFHIIECCQCIEHWNFSPISVFRQIFSRLLPPNGKLIVTIPNATSLYRRLAMIAGRTPYPSIQGFIDVDRQLPAANVAPHWREYTIEDVRMLVTYCGGHCVEVRTASYRQANNKSLAHRIYSLFNNIHPRLKENIEATCIRA